MYRMLSIPVTSRLTAPEGVKPRIQTARKSPAIASGPIGAPAISEVDRIRLMREQRRRNAWRSHCMTKEVGGEMEPSQDSPAP